MKTIRDTANIWGVRTRPFGWKASRGQCIAFVNIFCRQVNARIRSCQAENQLVCAAPKNQRPELTWFSVQFRIRIRLHSTAVESATCLQASRFSDARRLARHVLETSSEILHYLRPCRTVDTKSIEYRRRISRRRTSFASYGAASQPI